MKLHQCISLVPISLCLLISAISPALANRREACPSVPTVAPDVKTREINVKKYGVRFKIPANYKTRMYVQNNQISILVVNPSSLEYADCLIKNQVGTEYSGIGANILLGNINPGDTLVGIANNIQTQNHSDEIRNAEKIRISNQAAIKFTTLFLGSDVPSVLLFTPNKKAFVQIWHDSSASNSVASSKEIADMLTDSITFSR
jgi:hypothetical protein